MRQITREAIKHFIIKKAFKRDNTEVKIQEFDDYWIIELRLHNNVIAMYKMGRFAPGGRVEISTCGWNTVTTRERLNGLPGVHVTQRNFELFLNGEPWDGQRTKVELWL